MTADWLIHFIDSVSDSDWLDHSNHYRSLDIIFSICIRKNVTTLTRGMERVNLGSGEGDHISRVWTTFCCTRGWKKEVE